MHYESDEKAYDIQYEYLFGRDMLIAPVYEQDKHEWDVYLPQDEWVHLWTGEEYHGGEITVSAELAIRLPSTEKIVSLLIYLKKSEKNMESNK